MSDPDDLIGWSVQIYGPYVGNVTASLRLDTDISHSAVGSIRMDVASSINTAPYDLVTGVLDHIVVNYPNREYRLSGWVRSSNTLFIPTIGVRWFDSGHNFVTGMATVVQQLAANTWTYITRSDFSPIQAAYGQLYLSCENVQENQSASIWWDELLLIDCVASNEPLTPLNNAFTSGLLGWQSAHAFSGTIIGAGEDWDAVEGHTAPGSLKEFTMSGTSPAPPPYTYDQMRSTDPFAAIEGHSYQLSVWCKTDNLQMAGEPKIHWYGGSHSNLGDSMNTTVTAQTINTWQQRTLTATAPTGVVGGEVNLIAVRLNTNAIGNVWFDDITLSDLTVGLLREEVTPLVLPPGALPDDVLPAPGAMIAVYPTRWMVPGMTP